MMPRTRQSWNPALSFRPKGEIFLHYGPGKACLRTCLRLLARNAQASADTHRQAECRQVHQLFGDKLNTISEELLACARSAGRNETLAT